MSGTGRWFPALAIFLMPLPLFLPYLWLDHFFFWGNVDSIFYLNTYTGYREALWRGELFPHWDAASNFGLGGLAFYSLSPLAYSLTALLSTPFHLSDEGQFLFGIYASEVFGAWAMWHWLRGHFGTRAALAGALIYTLVPYRLVMLYTHMNLAQFWAVAFLPLLMRSAERLITREGVLMYGLALALCFYAHPLTVFSMGPVALAYGLYRANWQWRQLARPLLWAHLLALFLTAAYLAAMLTALPWMQMQHWGSDYFSSLKNLHHIDDYFGLYAPAAAYIFYRMHKTHPQVFREGMFWVVVLLILYVVATPLSYPLWAYVPAMNVFQFPFARLQPGMGLAVAVLGAAIIACRRREFIVPMLVILVISAVVIELRLQLVYGHHPDTGITPTIHKAARSGRVSTSTMPQPVYFPRWSNLTWKELLENRQSYESVPRVRTVDGQAQVTLTGEGNGWLSLKAQVHSGIATFAVSQFYIPAWRVHADNKAIFLSQYPDGRIQMALPKGDYELRLMIVKTPLEHFGDALTLAGLAFYVMYYVSLCRRRNMPCCA